MTTTVGSQFTKRRLSRRSQNDKAISKKTKTTSPVEKMPQEPGNQLNLSSNSSEGQGGDSNTCLKKRTVVNTSFTDTLSAIFPLRVKRHDIKLRPKPISDIEVKTREITFIATYKKLKVLCVGVFRKRLTARHLIEARNENEWNMSNKLSICRHMATYIDCFKASSEDMNIEYLKDVPNEPSWFFIKPFYQHGTLRNYLDEKKKKGLSIEPLYLLHMALTLFTALTDAHSQNIVLVNITLDSLLVGTDDGLYFTGFKSCVDLSDTTRSRKASVKCPEIRLIQTDKYKKETDVFCASRLLLELIQKPSDTVPKLYTQSNHNESITIIKENVDPTYESFIPAIELGLKYNYLERLPAIGMLNCFELMRAKALRYD